MQTWDHIEFNVATHYLPAIINDDVSGLTDTEEKCLDRWQIAKLANHVPVDAKTWHFTHDGDGEYIARDEVTWQMAHCCRVLLYWSV